MHPLPPLLLWALGLTAASGVPGLFLPKDTLAGQRWSVALSVLGAVSGLVSVLGAFFVPDGFGAAAQVGESPWFFWDPLSAFFLVGVFLLSLLGSIYGWGYWRQTDHPEDGRKLRLFYGWVTCGMALVLTARHAVVFLIAWEVMALSAFFLVGTEDRKKEVREASWVYFVATHVSTLLLFAFFAVLSAARGHFDLGALHPGEITGGMADALFLMALIAFGFKAGVYPFHVWLPSAHANAPSHVSAVLSGVLLKVGIYGLLRACWMFPDAPAWWGQLVVVLGIVSSLLGVVFALGQHDLKRLLAYHSIENIGIILLGVGLALWGRSTAHGGWVVLGLAGGLLHVWNHGLFKAALFYAAGSVLHATGTRDLEALGGLGKGMRFTSAAFLISAVAICGLPPLNGFLSEFLVYLGYVQRILGKTGMDLGLLAVPALALTGALALACFTKAYGAVFLGEPRSRAAREAVESPPSVLVPLYVLVTLCVGIGLFPSFVVPVLAQVVDAWRPGHTAETSAALASVPWGIFTWGGLLLWGAVIAGVFLLRRAEDPEAAKDRPPTWDCGYLRPAPTMQYTASSFAQMLVDLFAWVLVPVRRLKGRGRVFPEGGAFSTHVPETVLDRVLVPSLRVFGDGLSRLKILQWGHLQVYVLYILLAWMTLMFLG